MAYIDKRKIKVAVIGAGAAGLCAAKHLSCEPNKFEFVVYEQEEKLGGTWCYTENTGQNEYGLPVHSSMYENLRTNLPKETMAFPDFPFDKEEKSFLHHSEVLKYLETYAKKFDLFKYIKFQSLVSNVQPLIPFSPKTTWNVEVENVISKEKFIDTYDSVMVCNGHYSVPYMPEIYGIDEFEGILMHSHDYRNNQQFKDMKVVVLGAGSSGIDIAVEISAVAKEVILSHNLGPKIWSFPENIIQEAGVTKIYKNGVIFDDQKKYFCDALLLCTGYLYSYPFLDKECHINITDHRVEPLYKHLIHIEYPTLGIWGIPRQILPFPIYNQQVILFLKFLKGEITLPSADDMRKDADDNFTLRLKRGMKPKHAHLMTSDLLWNYDKQLSELGKFPQVSTSVRDLFTYARELRQQDILRYRENKFKIIDLETFVHVENEM